MSEAVVSEAVLSTEVAKSKPARKQRSPSKFILMSVMTDSHNQIVHCPVATGSTDRKLMAEALKLGDGKYEVHYVRRTFVVKTKSQVVIEGWREEQRDKNENKRIHIQSGQQ